MRKRIRLTQRFCVTNWGLAVRGANTRQELLPRVASRGFASQNVVLAAPLNLKVFAQAFFKRLVGAAAIGGRPPQRAKHFPWRFFFAKLFSSRPLSGKNFGNIPKGIFRDGASALQIKTNYRHLSVEEKSGR